ncbi:MAG: hypothetical protein KF763_19390 [Cyclobacteriaceae bacterium]|nr:hypothetical protein [Cyclobacteriaceae bacterium]
MKLKSLFVILFIIAVAGKVLAQDEPTYRPIRFLISGALEFGGDEIDKIFFTNGDSQPVNAGQGGSIAIGAQIQFPKADKFLLRGSIGYKYVTTQANNANIRLTRVPLQFTANYMAAPKLRLSGGVVKHTGANYKADGFGTDKTFKSNAGPVFEIAYYGIGLSFTALKYTDQNNETYSANAFGVTFSGVLPGMNK